MLREALGLLLAMGIWAPGIALIYHVEVVEDVRATARWLTLFSSDSRARYRLSVRDRSGRKKGGGTMEHKTTVEGDRATIVTSFKSPGFLSGRLSTIISKTGGFISAEGKTVVLGQKIDIGVERAGDIIHLRINHPGGTTTRRLPKSMLSPESASGFSTALPFHDVEDFHPGSEWETFLLDLDSLRVRPAVAEVDMLPARIDVAGKKMDAYPARMRLPSPYRAWYLEDGRVVKQEIPIGGNILVLERILDEQQRDAATPE